MVGPLRGLPAEFSENEGIEPGTASVRAAPARRSAPQSLFRSNLSLVEIEHAKINSRQFAC